MSSGTRLETTVRTKSEDASVYITAAEVEAKVKKAVAAAVSTALNDMQELINKKFAEFEDRLSAVEERLQNCAPNNSDQLQAQSQELASEVKAVRTEARDSMLFLMITNSTIAGTTSACSV